MLNVLSVKIADIKLDPENARQHGAGDIAAMAASLRQFGQRRPVVVQRSTSIVKSGNGLVMAAKSIGWQAVSALVVDDDDMMAKAWSITDNRLGELSSWNNTQLAITLQELEPWDDFDGVALGFSEADILRLVTQHVEFQGSDPFAQEVEAVVRQPPPPKAPKERPPAASPAPQATTSQVVQIPLTIVQHEEFLDAVDVLSQHYGTVDLASTVMRALVAQKDAALTEDSEVLR